MDLKEGTVVAQRYRVERVLGRGGMGLVVAATHLGLDERVAIKLLARDDGAEPLDHARFQREARIATKIKSEHVVRVRDVGALDDGTPFLVMEHLSGQDLGEYLGQRKRLPVATAVDFVLQACEAIAEAHSLGIVHRDLKPSNLFLTHGADGLPFVKVLDFGISKLMTPGPDGGLTRTTDVLGSPLYMAPEQMLSAKHVDLRADVWALGVILFELLTGDVPWNGATLAQLCVAVLQHPPPSIGAVRSDVPAELERVILRCLAKSPEDRYAHLGELAVALEPFAPAGARVSVERVSRIAAKNEGAERAAPVDAEIGMLGAPIVPGPTVGIAIAGPSDADLSGPKEASATVTSFGVTPPPAGSTLNVVRRAPDSGPLSVPGVSRPPWGMIAGAGVTVAVVLGGIVLATRGPSESAGAHPVTRDEASARATASAGPSVSPAAAPPSSSMPAPAVSAPLAVAPGGSKRPPGAASGVPTAAAPPGPAPPPPSPAPTPAHPAAPGEDTEFRQRH